MPPTPRCGRASEVAPRRHGWAPELARAVAVHAEPSASTWCPRLAGRGHGLEPCLPHSTLALSISLSAARAKSNHGRRPSTPFCRCSSPRTASAPANLAIPFHMSRFLHRVASHAAPSLVIPAAGAILAAVVCCRGLAAPKRRGRSCAPPRMRAGPLMDAQHHHGRHRPPTSRNRPHPRRREVFLFLPAMCSMKCQRQEEGKFWGVTLPNCRSKVVISLCPVNQTRSGVGSALLEHNTKHVKLHHGGQASAGRSQASWQGWWLWQCGLGRPKGSRGHLPQRLERWAAGSLGSGTPNTVFYHGTFLLKYGIHENGR
jgi:hypothetical protein